MPEIQRVIVIHGYGATPQSHWFQWLREQLPSAEVVIPELPDPMAPDVEKWTAIAAATVADADEHTVLIGHSLGAITALTALATLPEPARLAAVVLVAGFAEPLPGYAALDSFTGSGLDVEDLRRRSTKRTVFVADTDPIVDPSITARLASRLDATLITVPGAGHFQDTEGKTTFPELLPVLASAGIKVG